MVQPYQFPRQGTETAIVDLRVSVKLTQTLVQPYQFPRQGTETLLIRP
ncbi:conserved protein of unknown function [Limnospira indica PCC 8005]|uniref:Uncharacterized protein n=1 Tax=Limnospira indica PCC 8005 TaxID=376219 RepID=A0A9P1KL24_9CYAN|nr:conserved protein of unknown function [Limnospira indica PCC 8005]